MKPTLEYINRKKESHFLISKMTKNGKERFYVVKDRTKYFESDLLTEVPRGFEFYEHPEEGRVVLRKELKSSISPDEVEVVAATMKNHKTVKDYIIDRSENSIDVYLAYLNEEDYPSLKEHFHKIQYYRHMLKFEKVDNRRYKAQRFCSLSRYYGWITMETSKYLNYLAEKYCFHIDKESLLKFWIEGKED